MPKSKVSTARLIAAGCNDDDNYWEVESICGRRKVKSMIQYQIKWVGSYELTWEPLANLCDSAVQAAGVFRRREVCDARYASVLEYDVVRSRYYVEWKDGKRSYENWESMGDECRKEGLVVKERVVKEAALLPAMSVSDVESTGEDADTSTSTTTTGEPPAIPAAPTGDVTFSWSDSSQVKYQAVERISVASPTATSRVSARRAAGIPVVLTDHANFHSFADGWLDANNDLSIPSFLAKLGTTTVPVKPHKYDDTNPIGKNITVDEFVNKYWMKKKKSMYLHQWQFPLSDVGATLCKQSAELPVFGDNLLKYWLDLPQCIGDSPLQYLFMGAAGTHSRLHKDAGGLAITIAPIVGRKECLLVHRDDSCLYDGDADVANPDLHKFPMLKFARVWKTSVGPGEIMVLPHGTYHECTNVSDCLSYSRFHLDGENLQAFVESWVNNDAMELEHETVLWNAVATYIAHVDELSDRAEKRVSVKSVPVGGSDPITSIERSRVRMLQVLRHSCREMERRIRTTRTIENVEYQADEWSQLIADVDLSLHEFRYRTCKPRPAFRKMRADSPNTPVGDGQQQPLTLNHFSNSKVEVAEINANPKAQLKAILSSFPAADAGQRGGLGFTLSPGDRCAVRFAGKLVSCSVVRAFDDMHCALISFDGYEEQFDELHPVENLRDPITKADVREPNEGDAVLASWGFEKDLASNLSSMYKAHAVELFDETVYEVDLNEYKAGWRTWVLKSDAVRLIEDVVGQKRKIEEEKDGWGDCGEVV